MRDAVAGRSVGKLLFGLVRDASRERPARGADGSLRRNLLFLLPGANLVAVCLESLTIVRDLRGSAWRSSGADAGGRGVGGVRARACRARVVAARERRARRRQAA
jgi:hypothetical protein